MPLREQELWRPTVTARLNKDTASKPKADRDFPQFGLKGLPEDAMPFSQRLLCWYGAKLNLVAPAARRSFSIAGTDPPLDSTGAATLDTRLLINTEKKY